jgi:archaellum component FlaF (FlaF/FlaG flagellin family)
MRPQVISITGTGTTAWIPLDYKQSPFNVSVAAVVNGTVTYDIEHTFDEIFDTTVTPTAFKHASITAQTANKDGNYAFPVRAIRVNNTAGTGTTTLTILQGLR